MSRILVKRLPHAIGLPLPVYQSAGSAGMDVMAALASPLNLAPLQRALIPTGLQIALPHGFEAQIRPRSGLALKHGITVLNSPGTIDADYRGEICVLLINFGDVPFEIMHGMRIAQMVVARVTQTQFIETDELPGSTRGAGGFGSTGLKS